MTHRPLLTAAGLVGLALASPAALVAHYTFDEASGATTALNEVTGSTTGTVGANVVTGTAGISGNAYSFSGATGQADIVDMGNASFFAAITTSGAYTLSAWVNSTEATGGRNVVVFAGNDADSNDYADLGTTVTEPGHEGEAYGRNRPNTNTPSVATGYFSDGATVVDGTWHHIAMTVDLSGAVVSLYVDGALANSQTIPSGFETFPVMNNFEIGRLGRSSPTDGYEGLVDDVQVYDEALDATGIAYLFANPGQAVPEPAGAALAGLGLLSLLRRRRA
ncbi:LamG domain-containing protein [Haloferula sargassicola]|uniref:LamG-like jellyroll fold domain-containing protein n=1 Tax=Haloferula sargassicola TaxID=490096 RepID=A0ABP9UJB9_9BACT